MSRLFGILLFILPWVQAKALVTEIGINYSYQKKTFNAANYYQTDAKGASLTFYFLEKFALEGSYTESFYESHESDTTSSRVVQQSSQISDGSLVYSVLSRGAPVQPFLKFGQAYIKKNQIIKYLNASAIAIPESAGWAPSYGAGLKIALTEKFSIKLSYDVYHTSLSDGSNSDDSSFKAGLSWFF